MSDEPFGALLGALRRAPLASSSSVAEDSRVAPTETDEARVRRMVDTHFDALWRFMRRLGILPADLDDAMQEVVVIAAQRLADIPAPSERSFLFGTAFRVASEQRRRRDARREVEDPELDGRKDPGPDPEALTEQARARALLDEALAHMPDDERAVFTLYEIEEMTMAEIAELLAIPPGTVASRLRRAREQFDEQVQRLRARVGRRKGRAR